MKILVIEDNQENIARAKDQLAGHDLCIMESFTEFFNAYSRYAGKKFKDNKEILAKLSKFDCVLTDINLPSPHDREGEKEGATGFAIVLRAIEAGVSYIGAMTDANHHEDVHSKALDMWIHQRQEEPFLTGKSRVLLDSYGFVECGKKKWGSMLDFLTNKQGRW